MTPPPPKLHNDVKASQIPPLPTPYWGTQGGPAFTIRATVTVKASPQIVLDALLDTQTWSRWNNFVPHASLKDSDDGRLRPDILFTEHVDMTGNGKPSGIVKMKLLMTILEALKEERRGFKVVWLGKGYPDWALRSERVHEIYEDEGGGGTIYNVFETFSGPLAWAVRVFVGATLVKRFAQWNGELKEFVEGATSEHATGGG